ncbi:MAG: diguanylate cyclase domain-containing protein [Geminicoccaceae bacterium]
MAHANRTDAEIALLIKLFARLPSALAINGACAVGTVLAFWFDIERTVLLTWFGLLSGSLWFRLIGWQRFQRRDPASVAPGRWRRHFTIGAGTTGLAWGLSAFLIYSPESVVAQTFLPFIVAGMVGGSLAVLNGYMPAFIAFLIAATGPFFVRYCLIGDATHLIMAVMILVYVFGLIVLGRSTTKAMTASVHLATVNEELISQLREKSSQLQATFDHIHQGVAVFDHKARLLTWNPRHRELHGYSIHLYRPGTHIRQFLEQDLARANPPSGQKMDPTALSEPLAPARFQQTSTDGRALDVERSVMPGGGFVATSTDITAHKRVEARMLHLAQHDPLTDLPNRLLFQDRLQHAMTRSIRSGSPLAVIMIDLDKFKAINDQEGHHIGDEVLKAVARRLRTGLRDTDTVARVGGDEFALVLPDLTSATAAIRIGEKMLTRIDTPLNVEDRYFDLSASLGIAIFPEDAHDATTLLQFADLAMYQAKAAGGGIRMARQSVDLHPVDNDINDRSSKVAG